MLHYAVLSSDWVEERTGVLWPAERGWTRHRTSLVVIVTTVSLLACGKATRNAGAANSTGGSADSASDGAGRGGTGGDADSAAMSASGGRGGTASSQGTGGGGWLRLPTGASGAD